MKVDVLRGYNPNSLDLQGTICNMTLTFHRLSEKQHSVLAVNTKRATQSTSLTRHENLPAVRYDVLAISKPAETFKVAEM